MYTVLFYPLPSPRLSPKSRHDIHAISCEVLLYSMFMCFSLEFLTTSYRLFTFIRLMKFYDFKLLVYITQRAIVVENRPKVCPFMNPGSNVHIFYMEFLHLVASIVDERHPILSNMNGMNGPLIVGACGGGIPVAMVPVGAMNGSDQGTQNSLSNMGNGSGDMKYDDKKRINQGQNKNINRKLPSNGAQRMKCSKRRRYDASVRCCVSECSKIYHYPCAIVSGALQTTNTKKENTVVPKTQPVRTYETKNTNTLPDSKSLVSNLQMKDTIISPVIPNQQDLLFLDSLEHSPIKIVSFTLQYAAPEVFKQNSGDTVCS